MKRGILAIVILGTMLFCRGECLQIVYPSNQNVKISSPITAFIGNEPTKKLTINGKPVKIHHSGGFKHPVTLNYGENTFTISNGTESKTYKITRPYSNSAGKPSDLPQTTYQKPIIIITNKDNSPLRSTPVDAGLNRLQHLQKGIYLDAIGEYKNFYKVKLARDDYAWISKSNADKSTLESIEPSNLLSLDFNITDKEEAYIFKTERKLPYVLSENGSGYDLVIYGLNDEVYPFGRYEFKITKNTKSFGYYANYNDDGDLVVKINKFKPQFKDLTITIDPGHGGGEKGTTGCLGDKEKDFNLKLALKLQSKLQEKGANIIMTRTNDKAVSLQDRVKIANDNNSQIFISIHANALPDSLMNKDITGTEVYYFYPQAKELSQKILSSVNEKTGNTNGKIKAESFAVVRNTNAVSVLIEAGYMIDPEENFKLISEDYQNKLADGIVTGLERYLNDI